MEDTLRVISDFDNFDDVEVLILVLMEDTLRVVMNPPFSEGAKVLILVLMEDTLRVQRLVSLCISSFDVCLPLWK